ncbi:integrator complex subunit 12-like [Frankliniella occidentalis]|uniref:Integrator complex subunit 12-like n=1 Tax=Frankliniella occidentalis TaxID=133901 RepID=A0A6J1SXG5_FRAOC|nr:integrator complex subunit 12-like [Frankliniella occidentalis]
MAAIDPVLSRGVKLLLSNDPDAAEQLRSMLADALCNKYGAGVKLPPKVAIEEPSTDKKLFDSALKLNSPSPPAAAISDESSGSASADLDDSFSMNFTELSCVVCGQFNVGVRNQLMECSSCQQLYHQDCHSPPVKELSSSPWDCAECLKKKQPKEVKKEITSPVSGGKPASFASLGGSSNGSSHKSKSSSSSSSHKSSKSSSSHSSHSSSSSSSSSKRHSTSSSSSSHKSSSHHKSSSSRHSK